MNPADAIAFIGGNLAAVVIALAIARNAVVDSDSPALRISVGISAFILVVSLLTLLLGCLGLLDAHIAAGLFIAPALAAAFALKRDRSPDRGPLMIRPHSLLDWSPLLPIALGLGVWWLARNLALGTYITNDDKTYHAAIIAQWLRNGQFSIVSSTYQAYFPLNGELLSLWFMLPFGHDGAVPLNGLIYLALFIALSLHFADELNVPKRWQLLPTVLVLASTPTFFGITSFTDLDFSPPVMVLAAVAFLLASLRDAGRSINWPLALIGGACAGFAVGMKVSFAPPIGLLCLFFAVTALKRCPLQRAIGACCLVAATVLCAGAYWYVRNWLLTGNPVYPAAAGPFEGPFGPVDQNATKLTVVAENLDRDQWKDLIKGFAYRPYAIAAVVVSGWIAAAFAVLRRRSLSPDQSLIVVTLLTVSLVTVLFFPITPFSGTNEVGGLETTGRYLNLFYLVGGLLAVLLLAKAPTLKRFPARLTVLIIFLTAFTTPFAMAFGKPIIAMIFGATILAFAALEIAPRLPGVRFPGFRYTPLLLPLIALATVPLNLRSTDRLAAENPVLNEIEKLPEGSNIALFNNWLYQGYSLSGRRQQHQPVRLLGDGTRYTPMHTRGSERGENEDFWTYERHHGESELSAVELIENLRSAKLDYLATVPGAQNSTWPTQHQLLVESAEFPRAAEGENFVIWDLREREPETGNEDISQ